MTSFSFSPTPPSPSIPTLSLSQPPPRPPAPPATTGPASSNAVPKPASLATVSVGTTAVAAVPHAVVKQSPSARPAPAAPPRVAAATNGAAAAAAAAAAATVAASKRPRILDDSSDEEDGAPLAARNKGAKAPPPPPPPAAAGARAAPPPPAPAAAPRPAAAASSDDDVPLAARRPAPAAPPPAAPVASSSDEDDVPLARRAAALVGPAPRPAPGGGGGGGGLPAAPRRPPSGGGGGGAASLRPAGGVAKVKQKAKTALPGGGGGGGGGARRGSPAPRRRSSPGGAARAPAPTDVKWTTLTHAGILFPPEYAPHGVRMLYEGRPVDLTEEQEEVATLYAAMAGSDYMAKPTFTKNFWRAFRGILGRGHAVQDLEKCDFGPIAEHLAADREAKKGASKEEKLAAKAARDAQEAPFRFATVDGRREQVGNFRVEPPGLFRGRGEHPKMGCLKRRIHPRDITINIGVGEPVPAHPYPGQAWKEVRHDRGVTWLAYWKDPVNEREYKYVWLAANSAFKSSSDLAKYEKARQLRGRIGAIRSAYQADWAAARDVKRQQMGVALYFIDILALRAGHEKDEDEADTVGCCTLKVENVALEAPSSIRFDFLGKDSIRYENTVAVDGRVYALVGKFVARDGAGAPKAPGDQLFDTMDAGDLNAKLKDIMPGLSVKVFRTYNASVTLDRLLAEAEDGAGGSDAYAAGSSVDEKKAAYDRANKEVAILCNHQRSVPKTHDDQMKRLVERDAALEAEVGELRAAVRAAKAGGGPTKDKVAAAQARLARKVATLDKARLAREVKEDLKTVALGTSKINYLDPRITVAWCKRAEVPIEKVFNKSLMSKFHWSMDVEPEWRF